MQLTANNKIFVLPPIDFDNAKLEEGLDKLRSVNGGNVRELIKELVPNFVEKNSSDSETY